MNDWLGKTKFESEYIKTRSSFLYFERGDCIKTCVRVAGLMDYIDHPVHDGFGLSFNALFLPTLSTVNRSTGQNGCGKWCPCLCLCIEIWSLELRLQNQ